jgi:hypothetical protein
VFILNFTFALATFALVIFTVIFPPPPQPFFGEGLGRGLFENKQGKLKVFMKMANPQSSKTKGTKVNISNFN